jgi:hypothetical protein
MEDAKPTSVISGLFKRRCETGSYREIRVISGSNIIAPGSRGRFFTFFVSFVVKKPRGSLFFHPLMVSL